jgi:hypothetical protein
LNGQYRKSDRHKLTFPDNLDELLLLAIQSVCNAQSIKIPWADVATTMRNNVSEGAIVQHLAKVRSRRVASNKEVPPPLRRGGSGAAPKQTGIPADTTDLTLRGPAEQSLKEPDSSDKSKDNGYYEPDDLQDELDEYEIASNSSDEDYGKRYRRKKNKQKGRKRPRRCSQGTAIKYEPDAGGQAGSEIERDDLAAIDRSSTSDSSSGESTAVKAPSRIVTLRFDRRPPLLQGPAVPDIGFQNEQNQPSAMETGIYEYNSAYPVMNQHSFTPIRSASESPRNLPALPSIQYIPTYETNAYQHYDPVTGGGAIEFQDHHTEMLPYPRMHHPGTTRQLGTVRAHISPQQSIRTSGSAPNDFSVGLPCFPESQFPEYTDFDWA